jgi:ThiF family
MDPRLELLEDVSEGDADPLIQRLDTTRVHIRGGNSCPELTLAVANLCARLSPGVTAELPQRDVNVPPFGSGHLSEIAARTIGRVRPARPLEPQEEVIVDIGAGRPGADIYLAADRWSLELAGSPVGESGDLGPATAAAAALLAAEVFKMTLPEVSGMRVGNGAFRWNLLNYRLEPSPESANPASVEAVCFGAGSVGSSVLYSLLLAGATGSMDFVDVDRLSDRNRLRYPLTFRTAGQPKVEWLKSYARGSGLTVRGHKETAAGFIHRNSPPPVAISAVDNIPARRDIVDALAHTTFNAGVDGLRFHVSRHGFADGHACLYCPYVDAGEALDEISMYVGLTGLSEARVRHLVAGASLTVDDVAAMKAAGRLAPDATEGLVGGRLQDAARQNLYAQAEIQFRGMGLAVSAPFVSALTGSILAAELQKGAGAGYSLDRRIDIDCSGLPMGLQTRPQQDASGRCLCWDSFRIDEYRRRWGDPKQGL